MLVRSMPAAGGPAVACRTLPGLYAEVKALYRLRDKAASDAERARAILEALEYAAARGRIRRWHLRKVRRYLRFLSNQVVAFDARIACNTEQRAAALARLC